MTALTETAPAPSRVAVKRMNFFCERAYPDIARALSYRTAWRVGRDHRLDKVGRQLFRTFMRQCALDAVKSARADAIAEANR